jgi:uncharacterized membrane protein YraQ (UPF0718 family)
MKRKGGKMNTYYTSALFFLIVITLSYIAYKKSPSLLFQGWQKGLGIWIEIIPVTIPAFLAVGLIEVLVPKQIIAGWLGHEAGWKGIWLGCFLGVVSPGGRFATFAIVASLYRGGAGLGAMTSYITSWALWSVGNLTIEAALVSPKFMFFRLLSALLLPPLAGSIAHVFLSKLYTR